MASECVVGENRSITNWLGDFPKTFLFSGLQTARRTSYTQEKIIRAPEQWRVAVSLCYQASKPEQDGGLETRGTALSSICTRDAVAG